MAHKQWALLLIHSLILLIIIPISFATSEIKPSESDAKIQHLPINENLKSEISPELKLSSIDQTKSEKEIHINSSNENLVEKSQQEVKEKEVLKNDKIESKSTEQKIEKVEYEIQAQKASDQSSELNNRDNLNNLKINSGATNGLIQQQENNKNRQVSLRDIVSRLQQLDEDISALVNRSDPFVGLPTEQVGGTTISGRLDDASYGDGTRSGERFTEVLTDLDALQDEINVLIRNVTRSRQYNLLVRLRPLNNIIYRVRHNMQLMRNSLIAIQAVTSLEKIGNSVLDSTLSVFLKPDAPLDDGNNGANEASIDEITNTDMPTDIGSLESTAERIPPASVEPAPAVETAIIEDNETSFDNPIVPAPAPASVLSASHKRQPVRVSNNNIASTVAPSTSNQPQRAQTSAQSNTPAPIAPEPIRGAQRPGGRQRITTTTKPAATSSSPPPSPARVHTTVSTTTSTTSTTTTTTTTTTTPKPATVASIPSTRAPRPNRRPARPPDAAATANTTE